MENTTDSMKQKILSILSGEQYEPGGRAWDIYDVWADASDFYNALDDARLRADFERVVVGFLYGDEASLQDFALQMCYELKIRATIPKLLSLIQEQHEYSIIGMACMALGAMEVKEAADFFEATDHIADLFRVDFRRAVPLIQRLVERTGVKGYDPRKAKMPPRPPLTELEEPFCELYTRFGAKGLFLLLEKLDIKTEDQLSFILDAITEMSYEVANDKMFAISKQGRRLTKDERETIETERQAIVEEVRRWLQSRVRHTG